jgi:hypothetical protein
MVILPKVSHTEEDTDGVHTRSEDENNESNPSSRSCVVLIANYSFVAAYAKKSNPSSTECPSHA